MTQCACYYECADFKVKRKITLSHGGCVCMCESERQNEKYTEKYTKKIYTLSISRKFYFSNRFFKNTTTNKKVLVHFLFFC